MRRARPIELEPKQREALERLARGRRVPVRLAERARIVLHAADGLGNQEIAKALGVTRQKAGRWRDRYAESGPAGTEKDAPRPGRKRRIDEPRRAAVVRKTLGEKPGGQTHWSRSSMAAATGLSDSTVGRIWREHGLKPHRVETFKLSNDPQFVEKLTDVVGLYLNPPEHAVVLSCDEQSQIQALDRTQPSLPMKPGRGGTMTHDYRRNGITSLFAAMNVSDGTIISRCHRRHRHQEWLEVPDADKVAGAGGPGRAPDLRQRRDAQAPRGPGVGGAAPAVLLPLHADQRLVAEHGRAVLPRPGREGAQAGRLLQRRRPDRGDQRVHQPAQREPQALHLDRLGQRHPRQGQAGAEGIG
jgi:transposase